MKYYFLFLKENWENKAQHKLSTKIYSKCTSLYSLLGGLDILGKWLIHFFYHELTLTLAKCAKYEAKKQTKVISFA